MSIADEIRAVLEERVAAGMELGVQVVVMRNDEVLADVCAGYSDQSRQKPVSNHSLFPVFSTGKAFFTTAALRLVERGELQLDQPVREIWPEFACNGKENVTVRQIFMHRSGVCKRPFYQNLQEIADWQTMRRRVENAAAEFVPGTRTQYQSVNYTWLLGELMLRCDAKRRSLRQIIHEEAIQPNSTGMIYFGVDEEAAERTVTLVRNPGYPAAPDPAPCWDFELETIMNNGLLRRACLPGFNCIASARGMAGHFSALMGGRILGRALLEEARRDISRPGDPAAHGLGYSIAEGGCLFGHGGYGGSQVLADVRSGMIFAYACNQMQADCEIRTRLSRLISEGPGPGHTNHLDLRTGQPAVSK